MAYTDSLAHRCTLIVSTRRHADDDVFIFRRSGFLWLHSNSFHFLDNPMKRSTHFPSLWGQSSSEAFCAAVVDFVQRHGAVSGIVKRMEELGLGAVARSWLGSEVHAPILSEQLHALFGTSALRAFAARLDLQPHDLVRRLSQTLPQILNHLASSQDLTPSADVVTNQASASN
jgi:uncharacterized protein YidB (DUF937 family)